MSPSTPAHFLREIMELTEQAIQKSEVRREYAAKFRFEVIRDICKDCEVAHIGTEQLAGFAAQSDESALQMLRTAAADGLSPEDAGAVTAACDLIVASAIADRQLERSFRPPDRDDEPAPAVPQ